MYSSRKRGLLLAAALFTTAAADFAGAAEPGYFGYGSVSMSVTTTPSPTAPAQTQK